MSEADSSCRSAMHLLVLPPRTAAQTRDREPSTTAPSPDLIGEPGSRRIVAIAPDGSGWRCSDRSGRPEVVLCDLSKMVGARC